MKDCFPNHNNLCFDGSGLCSLKKTDCLLLEYYSSFLFDLDVPAVIIRGAHGFSFCRKLTRIARAIIDSYLMILLCLSIVLCFMHSFIHLLPFCCLVKYFVRTLTRDSGCFLYVGLHVVRCIRLIPFFSYYVRNFAN